MIEDIVNEDFEKTSNSIKSPDEAVDVVSNMEVRLEVRSKKSNILLLAYQQGQIFEKFKSEWKFHRYGKGTRY